MSENLKLFLGGIAIGFGFFMWGWYVWQDWQALKDAALKSTKEKQEGKPSRVRHAQIT